MANSEQNIKMSESADKGQLLNRRGFIKLASGSTAAALGLVLAEAAPAWAKAAVKGVEQGTLIAEHEAIIANELPGVKTQAILLDLVSRSGIHQIMEEETADGRVIHAMGQSGRRIGVIPGSGRQTVAFETLVAEVPGAMGGERVEVGMRLPEGIGNDRYIAAAAAQFIEDLDRGVDKALGVDLPVDNFAVALRAAKGTPAVHLGEHSQMRVEPEPDPNLVLKPVDLAAIIQRSGTGAAYILKVNGREVTVRDPQVIRDERLASVPVMLSGVQITENMLPTPAAPKVPGQGGSELLPFSDVVDGEVPVMVQVGGDACGDGLGLKEGNWTGKGVRLNPDYKSPEGLTADAALKKALAYARGRFYENNPGGVIRVGKVSEAGVVGVVRDSDRLAPVTVDLSRGIDVRLAIGDATTDLQRLPYTSSGACPVYPSSNEGYGYAVEANGRLMANGLVSSTWIDHVRTNIGPDEVIADMMLLRIIEDVATLKDGQFANMQGARDTNSTEHRTLMGILGNPRDEKHRFMKVE